METSTDTASFAQRAARSNILGLPSSPIGVPFGSDASKFNRAGIPSIVMGPGSIDQAHTASEYVSARSGGVSSEFYKEIIQEF